MFQKGYLRMITIWYFISYKSIFLSVAVKLRLEYCKQAGVEKSDTVLPATV